MKEVVIGVESDFADLPAEIELERSYYYLIKDRDNNYRLVSRFCPHAGYLVEAEDGEFECPLHGWTFDLQTGACLNVPSRGLKLYDVILKEGELIALL